MKFNKWLGLCLLANFAYATKFEQPKNGDGVHHYQDSHEQDVKRIARQHASDIFQFYHETKDEGRFDRHFKEELLSDLKDEKGYVFLKDNKPVGFVTYLRFQPWHLRVFNKLFGASRKPVENGYINALAVDENQRGKGYGVKLMQHAMDDFKNNNVYKVRLTTIKDVHDKLKKFYSKFGFSDVRTSKYSDWSTLYIAKLSSNPWLGLLKKAFTKK